ncbi:glycosyltransferase [Pseudoalteromonas tetraodonis]|uniref:glycosyltransferase n=1 Tax=Pseudoalteromonas tetraodonis TaxID=43659 RepID=UPI003734D461
MLHIIVGLGDGGAEATLFKLIMNSNNNIRHSVICFMDKGKYGQRLEDAGVDVVYLNQLRGGFSLTAFYKLCKLIRVQAPSVIQTWMYHADVIGGIAAKITVRAPVFWGIRHTDLSRGKNSRSTLIFAKIASYLSYIIPNKIIACAKASKLSHIKFGYANRFEVINNGYDLNSFYPSKIERENLRRDLGIAHDELVFGLVARWHPQKDHETLLKAFSLLNSEGVKFKFILIGTGCDDTNLELVKLVDFYKLNNCSYLLGIRKDVRAIMNSLDIHILSSLGEGFPNVLAEAMACGVPCIATDVGDSAVIVGDLGWLLPPSEPILLKQIISNAIEFKNNKESWLSRKKGCAERIRNNFEIKNMISSYERVWLNSLSKRL